MCGIAGLFRLHPSYNLEQNLDDLQKMPRMLEHRGPDHIDSWNNAHAFLSQSRLKVIDLSEPSNQPIFNEDRSIVLIFNGEIYNFKELRQTLKKQGHTFSSNGDSEVIVHLYEEKGEAFVEELDGMFALGLYDQKRQKLILSRDRTGQKPLFYYQSPHFIAFASEIKAFFPVKSIPKTVQTPNIPYYFLHGHIPTPDTFYKDIYSVEPAHTLVIEPTKGVRKIRYWEPEHFFAEKQTSVTKSEAISNIRSLLNKAVSRRLIADVPLGAFLSGGIDSTIITAIVRRELNHPLKTFSIGFEGDPYSDETPYAKEAANYYKTDHTPFYVNDSFIPQLMDKMVWHYDGPFGDASCIPTSLVSQLARKEVTVVLTGDGGDEVFGGYKRFLASLWLQKIPKPLRRGFQRILSLATPLLRQSSHRYSHLLQRLITGMALPLDERLAQWTGYFHHDLEHLLNRDFLSQSGFQRDHQQLNRMDGLNGLSPLSQVLLLNMNTYLVDDLNVKLDRASMMYSLEARSPFLDHHLMEYCFSLPDHFLIQGSTLKYILREAYRDLLPPSIYNRGKKGFSAPLEKWFRGPLKSFLQDELQNLSPIQDFINPVYVQKMIKHHMKGEDYSLKLWNLLMFKKWYAAQNTWT